jgi:hypothetical protein
MSGADLPKLLGENWCITVLRPTTTLSRDAVTARVGAVVAEPVAWDRSMDRFMEIDWDRVPLRLHYLLSRVEGDDRTWVVVEPHGIEGSRAEAQAVLSQDATTFT